MSDSDKLADALATATHALECLEWYSKVGTKEQIKTLKQIKTLETRKAEYDKRQILIKAKKAEFTSDPRNVPDYSNLALMWEETGWYGQAYDARVIDDKGVLVHYYEKDDTDNYPETAWYIGTFRVYSDGWQNCLYDRIPYKTVTEAMQAAEAEGLAMLETAQSELQSKLSRFGRRER